ISNISGSFDSFGTIKGHAKAKISDIRLEAIHVQLKNEKLRLGPVDNLVMKDVIVNGKPYER
ncbi:MAG: hypothetical protein KGJ37_04550, partial [Verrucomicrobiota bacterium]|nr:hypothetical protein [Verrucomicrobiota bacterium]